jgi:hypothetical protein
MVIGVFWPGLSALFACGVLQGARSRYHDGPGFSALLNIVHVERNSYQALTNSNISSFAKLSSHSFVVYFLNTMETEKRESGRRFQFQTFRTVLCHV